MPELFQGAAVQRHGLHGASGLPIAAEPRRVAKGRIEEILVVVRIVVLDDPVQLVRGAVADQLLAIDEQRRRQHEHMLDVRIGGAPLLFQLGVVLRLNDRDVGLGICRRGDREHGCKQSGNGPSMHLASPSVCASLRYLYALRGGPCREPSRSKMRSGVSGRSANLTPVASVTALAMAGATALIAHS